LESIENTRRMLQYVVQSNPLSEEELEAFTRVQQILSDETKLWRRPNFVISPKEKDQYDI